jgi:hypothetical protein
MYIHLIHYFNPTHQFLFRFVYGVQQSLEQTKVHYDRLVNQWKTELQDHVRIAGDKYAGYESFLGAHEEEATRDYELIRTQLDESESKVKMLAELVDKIRKEEPYSGIFKLAAEEKKTVPTNRPIVLRPRVQRGYPY